MNALEFLGEMATAGGFDLSQQQVDYTTAVDDALHQNARLLAQMDAGGGKTIPYCISGMMRSRECGLPIIIATSTVHNRNEIAREIDRIKAFAQSIGHPIGELPVINYRSSRDYCSRARIQTLLQRLRATRAPASVIADMEDVLQASYTSDLVEDVLPQPITDDQRVYVTAADISLAAGDEPPESMLHTHDQIVSNMKRACVILVTHAMLAKHRALRNAIKGVGAGSPNGETRVAGVIIDECDRLLAMNFLADITVNLNDVVSAMKVMVERYELDPALMTEVEGSRTALMQHLDEMKPPGVVSRAPIVIINNQAPIRQSARDGFYKSLRNLIQNLNGVATALSNTDFQPTDAEAEIGDRVFADRVDELIGAMETIAENHNPAPRTDTFRFRQDADVRTLAQWHATGEITLHLVMASPGRSMMWLLSSPTPVILTTALVGIEPSAFARRLGYPGTLQSIECRFDRLGDMHFIYVTDMPPPILKDTLPGLETAQVSPEFLRAAAGEIRNHYRPGTRMLVLAPAYRDLTIMAGELGDLPLFVQHRQSNFSSLQEQLVAEPGILLSVRWEGYNIVGEAGDGRNGILDSVVVVRLPFSTPNPVLWQVLANIYGKKSAGAWIWTRQYEEVARKVYQGVCRLVRGPNDQGDVLILDERFPAPEVLRQKNPLMPKPTRNQVLLQAIPERFAYSPRNFSWREHGEAERRQAVV